MQTRLKGWVCSQVGARRLNLRGRSTSFFLAFSAIALAAANSGCVGLTSPATLSANPSAVTFGDVEVGTSGTQALRLTNAGKTSLTVSEAALNGSGFTMTGQTFPLTLMAGASSALTLEFAPTAASTATGNLSLATNGSNVPTRITLSGSGVRHHLSVIPANINFGNVAVGTIGSQTVTLTNSGTASLSISQGVVVGTGFSMGGSSFPLNLAPGQSANLEVEFTPSALGGASGSVSFTSNAHNSPTVVPLSGTGDRGTLSANPLTVGFGNILVGSSASSTITLTNSGTASVTISQAVAAGAGFSMSGLSMPMTLNAGQTATFSATFSPASSGTSSGSISITSNAPSSPLTIALNGTGTQPQLAATPSSTSFGSVAVGTNNSQSIKLTNGGTASVSISQASVSGAGFSITGLTTPLTIGAGGNSIFSVVFAPTAAGAATGSVSLASNAPNSPVIVSLTGTAVAPTSLVSASPTSLGFGNVNVGASKSLSATLTNSGNSNVTISGVTTAGTGFNATGVPAGTILTPNQSATLNVAFAPANAGSATGSISVGSNATNSPAAITLTGSGVQQASAFPVWVMSTLTRVGPADPPGTVSAISLSGARGETVDTQVIVQGPANGLTNVNVSASTLTGPGGMAIPASSIALYREYYITVTGTANYGGGSNPPLGSGTYPEPLIPFNDPETGTPLCGTSATLKACNASVGAGQNQPYWIDINVPHGATNAPTGTYTGTISVTADQGTTTIPVTLTVWNFGLPTQPSELSNWTLWSPAAGNTTATLARALMRNRIMGWYDDAANAASDISTYGLNRSSLDSYYFIGILCGGSYSSIPSTGQINSAAANFPAGLPLDLYVGDELNGCPGAYSALKTMGTHAHAANPSVKTTLTINTPDPNLYNEGDGRSAIDHWVLLDSMQQWPALPFSGPGDLWSYTSCNPGFGNTPEWMVDYPPINERIQAGFLNWTQGATGLLYYRSDGWTADNTIGSWNNVDTTACGGGMGRPGDGIFVYPPGPIGSTESAPGIRLKAIRDGIQDYEYAHILSNLTQTNFLNPIILPIAASWTNWTHSAAALEGARLQLGQQLHLLAPPGF